MFVEDLAPSSRGLNPRTSVDVAVEDAERTGTAAPKAAHVYVIKVTNDNILIGTNERV